MSLKIQNPFLGVPLKCTLFGERLYSKKTHQTCKCSKNRKWVFNGNKFMHFFGQKAESLWRNLELRSSLMVNSVREPFVRSNKSLVKYMKPVWEEGLFLFRCSVLFSVVSGVCLLVWYGQSKAKSYVETELLPSVCMVLSERIQREVEFGRVRRISPLSITLESCSIGPHSEEFSCGEVPSVKLRILPFASLSRGKIVVEAVLTNPSLLVAQKKNYTWLGIPFSDGVPYRHVSSEEGIDYRTRTKRIAKEEGAVKWERERDDAAMVAAEKGYEFSDCNCVLPEDDRIKESVSLPTRSVAPERFYYIDEQRHWRDHHCMDAGAEYDLKHADLEKSFGAKISSSETNVLLKFMPGFVRNKYKRKASGRDLSVLGAATKRRLLERSASAARLYFQGQLLEKSGNSTKVNVENSVDKRDVEVTNDVLTKNEIINMVNKSKTHFVRTGSETQSNLESKNVAGRLTEEVKVHQTDILNDKGDNTCISSNPLDFESLSEVKHPENVLSLSMESTLSFVFKNLGEAWSRFLVSPLQKVKSEIESTVEDISTELVDEIYDESTSDMDKNFPVILDSVQFRGGKLMLLAYGDMEPREMEVDGGHVKFQNRYGRVHVQLSGNCKMWRSNAISEDGGWLSTDVYVDIIEQKWHVNLKVANLYVPLFERLLDLPIIWSKGRASGEVHICMSNGETFPNLHGQLDVTGLGFQIYDAPSCFSDLSASLFFRAQRIFLHNARGWFGDIPLEASGDFGIDPEEGEYQLMCQVPSVEVNALMKTFKMKPFLFPLAGSVTAVFNCQGPLDAPVFVGSTLVSRKLIHLSTDTPQSAAYEAMMNNKEAGAVAAIDHIPLSYVSANFTFNTDNCVADLYGIRATLVDGGEVRGAGNAWICPEGEVDEAAMDVNVSGNICIDKIMHRYIPGYLQATPLKLGDLNGETKISGSLLRPRFDIKWTAPKAEGSLSDARGDVIISHDHISINSSSAAFELYTKVLTSYPDANFTNWRESGMPFSVEGIELDLRMRNFEFFNLVSSYTFDSLRPVHLKATGRVKFQGKVNKSWCKNGETLQHDKNLESSTTGDEETAKSLSGDVSISGLKLNQLMLAPQLAGVLNITSDCIKLDATGRPDESFSLEFVGPLQSTSEENMSGKLLSFSLQKGHLKANACYRPLHSANLEVRNLPLDELELASLRGAISRAEVQLNFQKRRGHGMLSVLRPKFSGVLGEALDVTARWSGDVITVEKAILEQINSKYELQGEYVLPGSRDRNPAGKERGSLFEKVMTGHLGSMISSMGRWRMRLEVPKAEIADMLPLARLLSRSSDPAIQSRSKDLFIQSLQSVGVWAESLQKLLEEIRGHSAAPYEVVVDDIDLPGLAELKGRWNGCLDASGGGNGDTTAEFDFHGEEWEWGTYTTQRILAAGMYSNNDGLRLEKIFIQRDNATIHADGTLLGPKTNLHFAVLNFPVSLVPTLVQVIENSATEAVHSLKQLLTPIRGILHMEGDLKGNLAKPECDVQVRLLDGAIGGIDLGRAEVVASLTPSSRFLFNAKFEPVVQNGHVHIQGSVPLTLVPNSNSEEEMTEREKSDDKWVQGWETGSSKTTVEEPTDKKGPREKNQEIWDAQLAESLKGLNWNILDAGEVRIDADIKDGGMMLLTAISPYANWLHGNAEVMLQVRGTVEQPVLDGSAYFHRGTVSSPVLRKPITNLGGTVLVNSNRLRIGSLEGRVSRKGKLSVKGNLPLRLSEASLNDKLELKCEVLEVLARNILSGQVDSQLQVTGSIMQPSISGKIKVSHGEAYLPHDKGSGGEAEAVAPFNRDTSNEPKLPIGVYGRMVASTYVLRFLNLIPTPDQFFTRDLY